MIFGGTQTTPAFGIFHIVIDGATTNISSNAVHLYTTRIVCTREGRFDRDARSFVERVKVWLAWAQERARARGLLELQILRARRAGPGPERPLRLPRGRVPAGSSRYRVMFY